MDGRDHPLRVLRGPAALLFFPPLLTSGGGSGGSDNRWPSESPTQGVAARGTCTVHTDPQCSTFDGALFRFMAPCTYILAQTCSPTGGLPMFSVEVVNERSENNASESAVQQVNVQVNDFRLSLFKRETWRAMVNGVWQTLPLTLNGAMVNIRRNPAVVTVETDDKVLVSYDSAGTVHVKLPAPYAGKVCGMCGNFNNRRDDDNRRPDGLEAPSATDLAQSWQTGEQAAPCNTILVPNMCDPMEEDVYGGREFCGELLSTAGPFSRCLSVLGVESYYRSCVAGMCAAHGDPAVMCRTLQSYADICYDAGAAVPSWRNATLCPLECGANSHYEACAEGCQDACSGLDVVGACGSCEEKCVCDPGFKLSGGTCVLAEACGCWSKGHHYRKGEMFIEEGCTRQCQCLGNGQTQCSTWSCADHEFCKDKDGVNGCFHAETVTCSVYGDPHYITYDQRAYNFQGGCNYTLATTCGEHSPVHNNKVNLPYSYNGSYGTLKVHRQRKHVVVETNVGLRVMIDGKNRLFLQVDERYKGQLCGLCGTYSGWQLDDFLKPDGSNAAGSFDFGNSWRVPEDSSPCIANPEDPKICDPHGEDLAYSDCSALFRDAFSPCHAVVHPQTYISSCVYDHCATNGEIHTLCDSLESYAATCQVAGVELHDWKNNTVCEGYYMYIEADGMTHGDSARLLSSQCEYRGPLCLKFWYHMYGSATAMALNIYQLNPAKAEKVWSMVNDQGSEWHPVSIDIKGFGPFQIIIEAIRGSNNLSDVAIDDISINYGSCQSGHYVYIEANNATYGDTARLLSSECSHTGPQCLQFWYHMYGSADTMGLHVYLLQNRVTDAVWWKTNDQGDVWHQAMVDFTPTGPFQIIIEGRRGSNALSDVAVDDVKFYPGPCSGGHYLYIEANNASYGDTARILSSECSHRGPQCLQFWYHMYGSADTMGLHVYLLQNRVTDAVWWKSNDQGDVWHQATVEFTPTGPFQPTVTPVPAMTTEVPVMMTTTAPPQMDKEPGGHYLYIEANNATYGDTARLLSSECSHTGPQCLQFWYHMYGSADTMGLHVYLLQNRVTDAVWWKSNDQGDVWHQAMVEFTPTGPFQFKDKWYTAHCSQKCECDEDDGMGKIDCDDQDECDRDDVCLLNAAAQYDCLPTEFSKCTIERDPEYRTFDNLKHQFSGEHSYVLAQTSDQSLSSPGFYVEGINTHNGDQSEEEEDDEDEDEDNSEEHRERHGGRDGNSDDDDSGENDRRHRLRELKIRVYNHTVEFKRNRLLVVDGTVSRPPVSPSGGLTIRERSSHLYLKTDFGLSVKFDGQGRAEISLPHIYRRKVGGLCGNFDGRKSNDLMKPGGWQARSVQEFGQSWRVNQEPPRMTRRMGLRPASDPLPFPDPPPPVSIAGLDHQQRQAHLLHHHLHHLHPAGYSLPACLHEGF
ncbi:hypothetical protein CRUP_008527 [Coryphaenoides rupestris]|nr:hypothetical protein CRUP_008527 [Coryphaenoides rupestris]